MKSIFNLFLLVLALVNTITFAAYGIDKIKAVNNAWRISEKQLLVLSLAGPFGAYLAMKLFRHKVKKPKFYVTVPLISYVHIGLIVLVYFASKN